MKQRIAGLLCLLLAVAACAGCNRGGEDAAATGTPDQQGVVVLETQTPGPPGELPTPEPTEELPMPDATPEEPLPEGGHAWTLTPMGQEENLTFDLSGVGDATAVGFVIKEGADDAQELWLDVNETPFLLETEPYAMFFGAWLYVKDGVATLMATMDLASCDYETFCWQLQDGKPVLTGRATGAVEGPTDDGDIVLGTSVNVLGTWWAFRPYETDAAGRLVPLADSLYEIVPADDMSLRTTDELPVELFGVDGYAKGSVPAGTTLTPLATDDERYFYFILDDGREGRVEFERREYEVYIDGVSENEYFEELMYAG